MVYRDDLVRALNQDPPVEMVEQVMRRECGTVSGDATLEQVFEKMNEIDCSVLPVVNRQQVIGLISLENIGEWMMFHSTGKSRVSTTQAIRQPVRASEVPHDG